MLLYFFQLFGPASFCIPCCHRPLFFFFLSLSYAAACAEAATAADDDDDDAVIAAAVACAVIAAVSAVIATDADADAVAPCTGPTSVFWSRWRGQDLPRATARSSRC